MRREGGGNREGRGGEGRVYGNLGEREEANEAAVSGLGCLRSCRLTGD